MNTLYQNPAAYYRNRFAEEDLNIYIDITPEQSIERLKKGRSTIELYETLENLQNVHDKYFEVMDLLKGEENIFVVNGNKSPEEISNDIWSEITKKKR